MKKSKKIFKMREQLRKLFRSYKSGAMGLAEYLKMAHSLRIAMRVELSPAGAL